jgi:2-C-methyl-D-erythritol 2,4-cyclodiphosphate synthase
VISQPDAVPAIGHGYDTHRLVAGRQLVLGGVVFDHPMGLEGHSDADVILHAIMDALLGAAALGDIGRHFPNTDEHWRDTSSLEMLDHTATILTNHGWSVGNVDATVVAEAPRIANHIAQMRSNIASHLSIRESQVNVKATTAEGTGPEGRRESISAHAVALLIRR